MQPTDTKMIILQYLLYISEFAIPFYFIFTRIMRGGHFFSSFFLGWIYAMGTLAFFCWILSGSEGHEPNILVAFFFLGGFYAALGVLISKFIKHIYDRNFRGDRTSASSQ